MNKGVKNVDTDEKIQILLQMQEQGQSIEQICQVLGLGSSRALSNLANRKGYKFDKGLKKYIPKGLQETIKVGHIEKQKKGQKERTKTTIEQLQNKIEELHKLINEKNKKILELEEQLLKGVTEEHNTRGAGRKERLSDMEKESIKMYRLQGKTIKEIAELYNCSVGLIHKTINQK